MYKRSTSSFFGLHKYRRSVCFLERSSVLKQTVAAVDMLAGHTSLCWSLVPCGGCPLIAPLSAIVSTKCAKGFVPAAKPPATVPVRARRRCFAHCNEADCRPSSECFARTHVDADFSGCIRTRAISNHPDVRIFSANQHLPAWASKLEPCSCGCASSHCRTGHCRHASIHAFRRKAQALAVDHIQRSPSQVD